MILFDNKNKGAVTFVVGQNFNIAIKVSIVKQPLVPAFSPLSFPRRRERGVVIFAARQNFNIAIKVSIVKRPLVPAFAGMTKEGAFAVMTKVLVVVGGKTLILLLK